MKSLIITYRVPESEYNPDDFPGTVMGPDGTDGFLFVRQVGWYDPMARDYVLHRDTDPAGGMDPGDLFNGPDETYIYALRFQQPDEECPYTQSHTSTWCGNQFCRAR